MALKKLLTNDRHRAPTYVGQAISGNKPSFCIPKPSFICCLIFLPRLYLLVNIQLKLEKKIDRWNALFFFYSCNSVCTNRKQSFCCRWKELCSARQSYEEGRRVPSKAAKGFTWVNWRTPEASHRLLLLKWSRDVRLGRPFTDWPFGPAVCRHEETIGEMKTEPPPPLPWRGLRRRWHKAVIRKGIAISILRDNEGLIFLFRLELHSWRRVW